MELVKEQLLGAYVRTKLQYNLSGLGALDFIYDTSDLPLDQQELLYQLKVVDALREEGLLTSETYQIDCQDTIIKRIELRLGIDHYDRASKKITKIHDFVDVLNQLK